MRVVGKQQLKNLNCNLKLNTIKKQIERKFGITNDTQFFIPKELISSLLVATYGKQQCVQPKYDDLYSSKLPHKNSRKKVRGLFNKTSNILEDKTQGKFLLHIRNYFDDLNLNIGLVELGKQVFDLIGPLQLPAKYQDAYFILENYLQKNQQNSYINADGQNKSKIQKRQQQEGQKKQQKRQIMKKILIFQVPEDENNSVLCILEMKNRALQRDIDEILKQHLLIVSRKLNMKRQRRQQKLQQKMIKQPKRQQKRQQKIQIRKPQNQNKSGIKVQSQKQKKKQKSNQKDNKSKLQPQINKGSNKSQIKQQKSGSLIRQESSSVIHKQEKQINNNNNQNNPKDNNSRILPQPKSDQKQKPKSQIPKNNQPSQQKPDLILQRQEQRQKQRQQKLLKQKQQKQKQKKRLKQLRKQQQQKSSKITTYFLLLCIVGLSILLYLDYNQVSEPLSVQQEKMYKLCRRKYSPFICEKVAKTSNSTFNQLLVYTGRTVKSFYKEYVSPTINNIAESWVVKSVAESYNKNIQLAHQVFRQDVNGLVEGLINVKNYIRNSYVVNQTLHCISHTFIPSVQNALDSINFLDVQ